MEGDVMSGLAWTDSDNNLLGRWYAIGMPVTSISERLDRTVASVKHRVRSLQLKRQPGRFGEYPRLVAAPGEDWRKCGEWYWVSSYGRVMSMQVDNPGVVLRAWEDDDGYHHVTLWANGKPKRHAVHRLVAWAFLLPPDEGQTHVAHRNGKVWDNEARNLRWATPKSNASDKMAHGTAQVGEAHPRAKCTLAKAKIVKNALGKNPSIKRAAKAAGVSYDIAADISRGRTWRHA